jgi:DNA-binding transcriptional LysR family regulator
MNGEIRSLRAAGRAQRGAANAPQSRLKVAHLRLIAAIEETEMVSAAAQAVNMSQPAASRMIGELEAILEAPLCERLSRGVRLTPLGHALARHARSVLLQMAQAEQEFADLRAGRRGVVSLGAVTAPAIDLAAPAMMQIRTEAPAIELNIKVDDSHVLARELLASRLDFIIARVPDDLDPRLFDCLTIGVEEARLIVRRGHPLLGRGPVPVAGLNAYEWVMQTRGAPMRRTVDNLFTAANAATPECFLHTSSLLLTMMLVARSDAIAPLSVEAARFACQGLAPGALALLPTDFSIIVQPYSLIALRHRALSPAAQTVYEIIRRQAFATGDAGATGTGA